ncbi:hypothetical protein GCM10008955_17600 [Deinococcus malanensis]|uniref:DUF5063 domain-containing protein n=1 Tax=Deinococcus malanensis TaxID=1706855 RepID=A0ABQ2ETV3_9DEIO|nr:hypothetical protein [Deinococcus malanensis]GGK24485.1 hypothetical protein GCM10008955_17600 [Deinococcus malanensis]
MLEENGTRETTSLEVMAAVQRSSSLILHREGASLADLCGTLQLLLQEVMACPNDICWDDDAESQWRYFELRTQIAAVWPELGFYDTSTGGALDLADLSDFGDAIDDLTDIAVDLDKAWQLAAVDTVGALSWLRFAAQTHWGQHVHDLAGHLQQRVRDGREGL